MFSCVLLCFVFFGCLFGLRVVVGWFKFFPFLNGQFAWGGLWLLLLKALKGFLLVGRFRFRRAFAWELAARGGPRLLELTLRLESLSLGVVQRPLRLRGGWRDLGL